MDSPLFFICSKLYYTEVVSAVILYKADLFADLWYTGSGSSLRCS